LIPGPGLRRALQSLLDRVRITDLRSVHLISLIIYHSYPLSSTFSRMSDTQKPAEVAPAPAPDTETPAPAAAPDAPDAPSAPADTTEDIVTEAAPPAEESAKDEPKKVEPAT